MSEKARSTAEKPEQNGAAAGLAVDGHDPWSCLHLIDRLEVGPVQIEPNRLVVPHRVVQGDRTDETQLIYRYAENVYDPADPGTIDLANMQAAQIAFNYGLFCDEIVFHGGYDEADRRFSR